MSTWLSATAVLTQLKAQWHLSSTAGSWLTIAVQLGFVLGAFVSSIVNLPDLLPPARVIAVSAVGAAAVNALLLTSHSGGPAIAFRFLTGFFVAGIYPPALKFIATWFKTGRGVALGVLVGALTLGTASPHLINALGGLEWRVVVVVASLLSLAGSAVALTVHEGPYPFPRASFDPRQIGRTFRNRGVRLASLGYFGHMWELYATWAWVHIFFTHVAGESPRTGATIAFLVVGVGALGCYLGGRLGDGWGRTRTTASAMAVSGLCALCIGFLDGGPDWIVIVVGLVWGFTVVADSAQFSTMVTELADQAYVGTALTLQLALGFTLTVITIWLIPVIESAHGWGWAFALLAPGPALGVVSMLRLKSLPEARQLAGGRG
jgi:MFS family permease